MSELTVLFYFPLFLCQKELKFDMVASSFVAQFVPLQSYLEGFVDFCLVISVLICPDKGILVGISVLMV